MPPGGERAVSVAGDDKPEAARADQLWFLESEAGTGGVDDVRAAARARAPDRALSARPACAPNGRAVECRSDGVLIHNLSDKRSLTMQVFPGPELEIRPLMVTGTHPYRRVRLLLHGNSATFAIMINTEKLGSGTTGPTPDQAGNPEPATVGFERIPDMSGRHRLLLTVLCLPALTQSGRGAEVPSYAEMAEILARHGHPLKPSTIRNGLDELRSWLTYERQIPGLMHNQGGNATGPGTRLTGALSRWAILSGNVTREDLDRLG